MAGRLLVTLGTDGVTDWVMTPDGQRHNLGPVSALRFVASLVSVRNAKRVLDAFLSSGEVVASVDEEQMWAFLAPHRARWSLDVSPSMPPDDCRAVVATGSRRNNKMSTIFDDLSHIERHIQALNEAAAKKATNLPSGVEHLVKLAGKIKSPNQSKNQTYYNLGEPKVFEVGDKVAKLSYDVYAANSEMATAITAKAEATVAMIDKYAAEGRRFNASKAKSDVEEVTAKVGGLLKVDLTAPWVHGDLVKLAARADYLHSLFAPRS